MNHEQIRRLCPQAHSQGYDWADCCEVFPRLLALETTPQNPRYHAEGNVGIHTRMVLDALVASAYFQAADLERREVLFLAALLHDLCKPETTVTDPITGEISQPGHSRRGAVDVRVLLWRAGVPFASREAICRIIAAHQVPFFAFDSRRGEAPEFIARKLSWGLDLADLVCVARRHAGAGLHRPAGASRRHRAVRAACAGRRLLGCAKSRCVRPHPACVRTRRPIASGQCPVSAAGLRRHRDVRPAGLGQGHLGGKTRPDPAGGLV